MWSLLITLQVVLLLPDITFAQGDGTGTIVTSLPSTQPTCDARTINYITDTLPQQCLTTGPIVPIPTSDTTVVGTATDTSNNANPPAQPSKAVHDELNLEGEDLSTSAFMSFEEWKAMMLAKSGPDALDIKPRRQKDGRADSGPGEGFDSLGEEGEISFDFDSYTDRLSEFASSARPTEHKKVKEEQTEAVTYDEGFTYHRSKDAGTTCKERFSYSSFDAGATVKKTSPGAKNPTAILVENKDSYMLLECGTKNKFFIVELSDVILVDTVVLASFEFFSSMFREFRVSISDRYPVKPDKWKVLGTFVARNSRDIQPFLVENPQDWARYLRVEILSHYGNEYYCPVSLLRVHGLRMLDSWKQVDPSELDGEDDTPLSPTEMTEQATHEATDKVTENNDELRSQHESVESVPMENNVTIMEQSCWTPFWDEAYFEQTFPLIDCTKANHSVSNIADDNRVHQRAPIEPQSTHFDGQSSYALPNISSTATAPKQTLDSSVDAPKFRASNSTSVDHPVSSTISIPTPASVSGSRENISFTPAGASMAQTMGENPTTQGTVRDKPSASTSIKPPSSKSAAKAASVSQPTGRPKSSATTSATAPTPTVQDSFFKALTKRLQILESNTTLSMQYIESQSRFLQEALAKIERKQIAKVDLFLDQLNNTVLKELREVRTLNDHIWQSTVIALKTEREQTEKEILALSTRVGMLADEVAFQKRMAILHAVLLLGCLVLVIFTRAVAASAVSGYYPFPSTPNSQIKSLPNGLSEGQHSAHSTPERTPSGSHTTLVDLRIDHSHSPGKISEAQIHAGSKGASSDSSQRPPTPNRTISDPSGMNFQPPTPRSMDDDMTYDSEPAMTPSGGHFSATASVDDDSSGAADAEGINSGLIPGILARLPERQLSLASSGTEGHEYRTPNLMPPISGRPGLPHRSSSRKPLPALPEDPD